MKVCGVIQNMPDISVGEVHKQSSVRDETA